MTAATRILLADDHELVRGMLAERLSQEADLQVVGTVPSADDVVVAVSEHVPDIVVLDIDMPGMIPFEAARTLRSMYPKVKVVFLSAFVQDYYIEQALDVGSMGYLVKSAPIEEIIDGLRDIANNRTCFSEPVQARIVVDAHGPRLATAFRSRVSTLTPREREVLSYIARGLATKAIAQMMYVSHKTVDNHRTSLMNKLDIHDRVELTRFAIREGMAEA